MKNIIFMQNVDLGNGRSQNYHYSINSWKKYADKYNCDLFVLTDSLTDISSMKLTWQRYYVFDILEYNNIEYDQILMVDCDTIVHPDAPNVFDLTDNKYCVVDNNGSFEWVLRSIKTYRDGLFNDKWVNPWEYFNCGFQIFNKSHKEFFKYILDFYLENTEKIIKLQSNHLGTDQTVLNYLVKDYDIDIKHLPISWNLQDLNSKQLLHLHPQSWIPDELIYKDCGWVFHFNAIPQNPMNRDQKYWIERTYREFYE